jgi:putative membrane protein
VFDVIRLCLSSARRPAEKKLNNIEHPTSNIERRIETPNQPMPNRLLILAALLLPLLAAAPPVLAHGLAHHDGDGDADDDPVLITPQNFWRTWAFEPGSVAGLALSAWLYAQGVIRIWRRGGVGHGIKTWEATSFAAGWFSLFVALVSPLHPLGAVLFSAHMTQHEILMLVAAPLMVLGRPMPAMLAALPSAWAAALARMSNQSWWANSWRLISTALAAWVIHGVILWIWHAPKLFQATLHNEWVHAAQHLSFFLSALLFWWAVIHGRQRAMGYGLAVLYIFTTALHTGLLGVLLTFATHVWYPDYAHTTQAWGLTPLEDQQLGGLIMWIPAGVVYVVAALILVAAWLRESEARVLRREQQQQQQRAAIAGGAS